MAGAFSFASFSRTAGRNGGWGIGELKGDITLDQAHRLRELIPSSINDGVDPGNYPSKEVVAQLTRRFAWLPNGDAGPGFSFYASAQAGKDSTNRPGNVFTFVQVCDDDSMGVYQPTEFLYSEEIPIPFGKNQVDRAEIPERLMLPGPITPEVLDHFLDGWSGRSPLPLYFQAVTPAERRRLAQAIAAATAIKQVVLACPLAESALWVAAVARSTAYSRDFSFSTFETADRIEYILRAGCKLSIVDVAHAHHVAPKVAAMDALFIRSDDPDWAELESYESNENSDLLSMEIPSLDAGPMGGAAADPAPGGGLLPGAELSTVDLTKLPELSTLSEQSVLDYRLQPALGGATTDSLQQNFNTQTMPLNSRVMGLEEFERQIIESPEIYSYLRILNELDDNLTSWVAKLVRVHELLTLDPNDATGLHVRSAFLALVLLEGVPQYWSGVHSFVHLTAEEKTTLVTTAKNYVVQLLMTYQLSRDNWEQRISETNTYYDNLDLVGLLEAVKTQVLAELKTESVHHHPPQY